MGIDVEVPRATEGSPLLPPADPTKMKHIFLDEEERILIPVRFHAL
jgi:hypothetical protein